MAIKSTNTADKKSAPSAAPSPAGDAPASTMPKSPYSAKKLLLDVSVLGVAFSLIFTGYNVAQGFVTTLYHGYGFATLCLIYTMFAIGSLFAPSIHTLMERIAGMGRGEQVTMLASGVVYALFILTLTSGSTTFVFAAGFLKGLASGLMWISQGVWLNRCIKAYRVQQTHSAIDHQQLDGGDEAEWNMIGLAVGVFFTIFNLNSIIGNAIVIGLLGNGFSVNSMIIAMAGVTALGTFLLLFLRNPPLVDSPATVIGLESAQSLSSANTAEETMRTHSVTGRLKSLWKVTKMSQTRYLMPYFLCQGMSMAYTYGNYPAFINFSSSLGMTNSADLDGQTAINIAYGFLFYGIGSVIGSIAWGRLYDFFKSSLYPLVASQFVLVEINFSLLITTVAVPIAYPASVFPCLELVCLMFVLTDFLTNAIINNSVSKHYPEVDVPTAFSCYRFVFCVGFAGSAAISTALPNTQQQLDAQTGWDQNGWLVMIAIQVAVMAVSVTGGILLQSRFGQRAAERRTSVIMAMH